MITLSYGFKLPETDDTGDIWFAALEFDITQLNSHSHNGTDSARLTPITQTISSGSWASEGNSTWSQTITITSANASLTVDGASMEFRLSNGSIIYPTVEKVTSTTYKIYINDNTQSLTALYTH